MSWRLNASKTALLVVDAQESFLSKIAQRSELEETLGNFIQACRAMEIPVYFTEREGSGETLASLKEAAGDAKTFVRKKFSAGEFVKEISASNVLLAGVDAHIGVRQTAYDFRMSGKNVCLILDALGVHDEKHKQAMLDEMRTDRVLATTVETCLHELLETPEHPAFEAVLKVF